MSLGKQAKVLSKQQQDAVLGYLGRTRYPSETRSYSCCQSEQG
jgi:hypothetical protein